MATTTQSDFGVGLGLLFSLVALGAAIATTVLGYNYAIAHAAGEAAGTTQITAAVAFGVALLAGGLAVSAIHVYDN
ncbi:hypothetical protein SAMN05216559_3185 [Halomicrobium zhouii]|uniref:Uncharacterized protein n=1 Tax=Halomicrobium zhouii TaxID=767519 RepID=A0A1I6LUT3_9EURY|nr:hypothetical protein [Halomicrobium zhouii]MCU4799366.1 hypothetical protein [Halobacteria archaeon HArc-gm2]SFS07261.1 hypothetical protein SAMN05216559_3185 [Halomicrobium zhouii]